MSQVLYNGVALNVIMTKDYRMEPIFDPSNTDLMYVRHRLSVVATVASPTAPNAALVRGGGVQAGDDPATVLAKIRHSLSLPRRPFVYTVNGVTLIDLESGNDGAPSIVDAAKGPIPRVLSCVRITTGTFLVEWAVEYHEAGCDEGNSQLSAAGIVSLRWSQTESIDERWYRRLSTRGHLIARTDMVLNADSVRAVVVPQPPLGGYLRTKSSYTQSPDGTRLDFDFEDRQFFKLPPSYPDPSVNGGNFVIPKVHGKFTISTGESMAQLWAAVQIHMEGIPNQSTQQMIEVAAAIAVNKIALASPAVQGKYWMATGSISEGIWDNVIDFSLRAKIDNSNQQSRFDQFAINKSIFGTSVEYAENVAADSPGLAPPLRQAAPYLTIVAAAFQDPCLAGAVLGDSQQTASLSAEQIDQLQQIAELGAPVLQPAGDAPTPQFSFTVAMSNDSVPGEIDDTLSLLDDSSPGVWEELVIQNTYERNEHVLQLPTMQSGAAAAIVQLAEPTVKMCCVWTASKLGSPPQIPPYESSNDNFIAAGKLIKPEMLSVSSDGVSLKYTLSGRYDYLAADASLVDDLACPIPPWLDAAAMEIEAIEEGDDTLVLGDAAAQPLATLPLAPVGI